MRVSAIALTLLTAKSLEAFPFVVQRSTNSVASPVGVTRSPGAPLRTTTVTTALFAEAEDEAKGQEEVAEPKTEEVVEGEAEEEAEDSEMVALKEEISNLEATLRSKRSSLSLVLDEAELYTESGYLRTLAEMDNYRKRTEISSQNNRFSKRAAVVRQFMPCLEELEALERQYVDNNDYRSLRWDLQNVLTEKLDMSEYHAEVGDEFNFIRYNAVAEEFNEEIAKGCIISEISPGLEIKGNVLRAANVIKSKGSETAEQEAAAEVEAEAEGEEAN